MMTSRLSYIRGALALVGPFIDELAQDGVQRARSITNIALNAPQPYHITLFTKAEIRSLPRERVDALQPDLRHIYPAGVGGNKDTDVLYIVIVWAAGQQLRKQFGLAPKQFHITLSAADNHDMDKGVDSLFPNQFPSNPTPEFIDPPYACTYERADDAKIQSYCIKKLIDCSKETEWGLVFQEQEITELPDEIAVTLLKPWPAALCEIISDRDLVPKPSEKFYKLPRFFRWLIPYHFAIMSTPRCEEDISALTSPALGIRHVLTLTEETPLAENWFRGKPITNTYLPVPNYHPPTIEQMDLIINLVSDSTKVPFLVHCGGGKGRAGTPQFHLSQPTMTASEAINALRSLRPGSIETSQQEEFVSKWCSTIWKRQSIYPEIPSEPPPCPMKIEGGLPSAADLFVLVGLPGSGKSWLSNALLARNSSGWIRISQDEAPRGRRVLLDRCNAAASDRKEWLKLASNWCSAPVCVWFDYDRDLCLSRAQMRAGHPTLPP
ncbi:hypothetical protein F5887DRAFT_958514, partial [Amanita rubescens]